MVNEIKNGKLVAQESFSLSYARHNTPTSVSVKAGDVGARIKDAKINTRGKWWADSDSSIYGKAIIDGEPLIINSSINNSSYIQERPVIIDIEINDSTVTQYCYVEDSYIKHSRVISEHKITKSTLENCDLDGHCEVNDSKLTGVLARGGSKFNKCKIDGKIEFWTDVVFDNVTVKGSFKFYADSTSVYITFLSNNGKVKKYKNPYNLVYKLKNATIKSPDEFATALGLEEIV